MFNSNRKLKITSLALAERAGYDTQYRRQYFTRATGESIEPPFDGLIGYSAAAQETLPIPNGWDAKRLVFMMEGECAQLVGGKLTFTVQGYTSHVGCTKDGGFDPDMEFIVNSVTLHRHSLERSPTGEHLFVMPVGSSQILVDPVYSGRYADKGQKTKVRPEDVFASMKLSHLMPLDVLDMRTVLDNRPICANRRHLIPAHYLNDILVGYKRAQMEQSFGIMREEDILETARGYVQEDIASHHPFLRAMSNVRDGFMSNTFNWRDLMTLDADVADVTTIQMGAEERREYVGWAGQDVDTLMAWTAAQTVRSVMDTLGVQQVRFSATNMLTKEAQVRNPDKRWDIEVGNIVSGDYGDVKLLLIESFASRLRQYVLPTISMRDQLAYRLRVDSNILGDTVVELALDGREHLRFCVPAFADSLYTPLVMTHDHMHLVNDLEATIHRQEELLTQGLMGIAEQSQETDDVAKPFGAI